MGPCDPREGNGTLVSDVPSELPRRPPEQNKREQGIKHDRVQVGTNNESVGADLVGNNKQKRVREKTNGSRNFGSQDIGVTPGETAFRRQRTTDDARNYFA